MHQESTGQMPGEGWASWKKVGPPPDAWGLFHRVSEQRILFLQPRVPLPGSSGPAGKRSWEVRAGQQLELTTQSITAVETRKLGYRRTVFEKLAPKKHKSDESNKARAHSSPGVPI